MISILLPTRNRLEYLKFAIESVLRQDFDDWEIIVYDNFSDQDIGGYVRSLNENRIRYFRTKAFVPVTENWNNALNESLGEYVIMLGDDDCLIPNALPALNLLIRQYKSPDLIYANGFVFAYPGVVPDFPAGYLTFSKNHGCAGRDPFWLNRGDALKWARAAMRLRRLAGFNMQYSVIRRPFIESLKDKGPFFQSPYPDYYATVAMWLKAPRILISPAPLTIIGITSKSFGYFYVNNKQRQGMETFLQNLPEKNRTGTTKSPLLPGSEHHSNWLIAMEHVRRNYGQEFGIGVDYKKYRRLQIAYVYRNYFITAGISAQQLAELRGQMTARERLFYGLPLELALRLTRILPKKIQKFLMDIWEHLLYGWPLNAGARLLRVLPEKIKKLLPPNLYGMDAGVKIQSKNARQESFGDIIQAFDFIGPASNAGILKGRV